MSDIRTEPRDDRHAKGKTDAILDAAQQLFARFGYRRTSMEDIAREAGVAKGTLYLYFDSKEDVFRAMHARTIAGVWQLCDAVEAADLPFAERIYQLLDAQCGPVQERYARSDHLLELDATRTTVGADLGKAAEADFLQRLSAAIARADQAGEVDLAATGLTAAVIAATIVAAAKGAKTGPDGPVELSEYRARLREIAAFAAAAVKAG